MNRQSIVVALATFFIAVSSAAQDTMKPIRYTWIVTSCERWNCAAAALVMAGSMEACHAPLIMNVPDGRAVIASLAKRDDGQTKRRRAVH